MMTPKVSVIIPVYNVEPYLRRCLDSVCGQTLRDIEILCVNDGSDDGGGMVLEEYALHDERIKIVAHAQNRGSAAARNRGMDAASGEFIYFVDSDDWIDKNYLEAMHTVAVSEKIDIVMNSNIMREYEDRPAHIFEPNDFGEKIGFNYTGYIKWSDYIGSFSYSAWCILWRKSFLQMIHAQFPEGLVYEDNYFHMTTFVHCEYFYLINNPSYHYFYRSNSVTANIDQKNKHDIVKIYELIYDYYSNHDLLCYCKLDFFTLAKYIYTFEIDDIADHFGRIKSLFIRMKEYIDLHREQYVSNELFFFDSVIASSCLSEFNAKYTLLQRNRKKRELISALRRNHLHTGAFSL
jgi:glycosyltransferase involved in cell wall biosynthesis